MLILVEGIDRVGKTTLVQKLEMELPGDLLVVSYRDEYFDLNNLGGTIATEKMMTQIEMYKAIIKENKKAILIIDRFHLSEFAYSFVVRNSTNCDVSSLDSILADLDTHLIYIRPIDLEMSEEKHGAPLKDQLKLMDSMFKISRIKNKYTTNYESLDSTTDSIMEVINNGR